MDAQTAFLRDRGKLRDERDGIHGTEVRRGGERQHRRLRMVRVPPPGGRERVPDRVAVEERAIAGQPAHDGAAREHRCRAALAAQDVCGVVTQHGTPWRAERRECQRIGGRPTHHREHRRVGMFEDLRRDQLQPSSPRVGSVRQRRTGVRGGHCGEDVGSDTAGVVAAQFDLTHEKLASGSRQSAGGRRRHRNVVDPLQEHELSLACTPIGAPDATGRCSEPVGRTPRGSKWGGQHQAITPISPRMTLKVFVQITDEP